MALRAIKSARKYFNFAKYIIIIETRMEILSFPSAEDLDEDALMDTNELWFLLHAMFKVCLPNELCR